MLVSWFFLPPTLLFIFWCVCVCACHDICKFGVVFCLIMGEDSPLCELLFLFVGLFEEEDTTLLLKEFCICHEGLGWRDMRQPRRSFTS